MGECSFTAVRDEVLCGGCLDPYCRHARKGEDKQMNLLKHMGERFQEIRERKGYTALDVAFWTGISNADLSRIEHGKCMMPYSVYKDICRIYGTTFSEFMSVYRWTYTDPQKMLMEVDFNENYRRVS